MEFKKFRDVLEWNLTNVAFSARSCTSPYALSQPNSLPSPILEIASKIWRKGRTYLPRRDHIEHGKFISLDFNFICFVPCPNSHAENSETSGFISKNYSDHLVMSVTRYAKGTMLLPVSCI